MIKLTFFQFKTYKIFNLFIIIVAGYTALAAAHTTIYTFGDPILEQVEQAEKDQRLMVARAVLSQYQNSNSSQHSIARLLLAKQLLLVKKNDEALVHIAKAHQILATLDQPIILLNAYLFEALTQARTLKKFRASIKTFNKAINSLPTISTTDPSNQQILTQLAFSLHNKLGSLYTFLGQFENAQLTLTKAQQLLTEESPIENKTLLFKNFSTLYTQTSQLELAEKYLVQSYALATESNNDYAIVASLRSMSRFYRVSMQYELSIEYAIKAVKISKKSKFVDHLAVSYNNLAISYEESGDDNLALVHYLNVVETIVNNESSLVASMAHHNIGETYFRLQDKDKAINYLLLANKKFKKVEHLFYLLTNNISLAKVYLSEKNYQQAISFGKLGLAGAQKLNKKNAQENVHQILADSYRQTNQLSLALEHQSEVSILLNATNDTLNQALNTAIKSNKQVNVVNMDKKIVDLKIINKKLLTKKNQQHNLFIACLIIAISVSVALGTLLVIMVIRTTKLHQLLDQCKYHPVSGLPLFHHATTAKNLYLELNHFQYLAMVHVPSLISMPINLTSTQAKAVQQDWLNSISTKIDGQIYQYNDSILLIAFNGSSTLEPNEQHLARKNALDQLLLNISQSAPMIVSEPLSIGVINNSDFNHAEFIIAPMAKIELMLTALSAARCCSQQNSSGHWCFLAPKNNVSFPALSEDNRENWLMAIKSGLITFEFNQQVDIDHQDLLWNNFNLSD